MRKLLLASAAMLGATAGIATAQTPTVAGAALMMQPTQGQMALPWAQGPAANNNNNGYGMPSTYAGSAAFGKNAVPSPGTVVIRLNGKVEFDAGVQFSTNNQVAGVGKANPINFSAYMRLYPGIDGMATNGLRYGASIELRQNFPGSVAQPTPALTPAPSASTYSQGETVYVRRAFVYLANDNFGILRMGTTDGVISLFDPCIFSSQCWDAGIGNFNGGSLQANGVNGANAIPFVWLAQAGAEYDNTKIVYLSPQFFGFDFGVQYAPNMGNSYSNSLGSTTLQAQPCLAASAGCIGTTTGNDPTRWLNQVAVGARYQGTFGGVNVGAFAVYETAGKEQINGGGIAAGGPGYVAGGTSTAAAGAVAAGLLRYDNLNFVNAALKVEVPSVGLTWAIDYIGGALNGQLSMRPTGGAPMNAVVTGLVYRNGKWVFGAEVGIVESQGQANLTKISQRKETEFAIGGTYNAAPGLAFVLEYMHTERHQGQFDFVTGTNTGTRDVKGNGLTFATIVTW